MNFKNLLTFLILILIYPNFIKADEKIVFIDIKHLMNNSLAGKSINDQLTEQNKIINNNFKKKENDLKTEESTIIAQKNVLDENQYDNKIKLFKTKVLKYNQNKKDANNEIKKKQINARSSLINSLNKILSEYTKSNSISIIISKEDVVLGKSELDITNYVLQELN